jgi:hypothetical protein
MRSLFLAFIALDFALLTGWAIYHHGIVGWIPDLLSTPIGITAGVDLTLALSIAWAWTWMDARRQGINPWPYLALTAGTGSLGLLVYFLVRERRAGTPV